VATALAIYNDFTTSALIDDSVYLCQDDFCNWFLKRGAEILCTSVHPAPLLRYAFNNQWMTFRDMVETANRYGIPQEFVIVNQER
jgi:hypothetical protein